MSPKGDKRDKGDSRDIKTWLAFKPDIQLFVMGSFAMFLLWIGWKNQSCIKEGFTKKNCSFSGFFTKFKWHKMIMIEIHTPGIYQTPSDYLSHLVRQISQETPWITNHFPRLVTYQNNLFNMLEISISNFHWIRTDLTKFWWNLTKTVSIL